MQLESIGKLKTIYAELKKLGNLNALSKEKSDYLEKTFKNLSAFELADKLSGSGLNNELKQQIAHNLDLSLSTELLSKTQSKSAAATTKLGTAFKGLAADTLSATGEILTFLATSPAGWALLAVAAITTVITITNKLKEEFKEQIRECTSDYREATSELSSYQSRVQELNDSLNSSTLSHKDAIEARKELLDIQNQLLAKYGKETSSIQTITDAIHGESDAFDELNQLAYQQMKNSVNDFTKTQKFLKNPWATGIYSIAVRNYLLNDEHSNFNKAIDKVSDTSVTIRTTGIDELDDAIQKIYNLERNGNNFVIKGDNLEDIQSQLLSIQSSYEKIGTAHFGDNWNDSAIHNWSGKLTSIINKNQEILDQNQQIYDSYILQERILANDNYSPIYEHIVSLKDQYESALADGNSSAARNYASQIASEISSGISLASEQEDWGVKQYFESLYPELREEIGSWQLSADITAGVSFDNSGESVSDILQSAMANVHGLSPIEILALDETSEGYTTLMSLANHYNLSLEQLINALITLKYLQSQTAYDLKDQLGTIPNAPVDGRQADRNKKINSFLDGLDDNVKEIMMTLDIDETSSYATVIQAATRAQELLDLHPLTSHLVINPELLDFLSNNEDLSDHLIYLSKTGQLDEDAISSLSEYKELLALCGNNADTLIQQLNQLAAQRITEVDSVNTLASISSDLNSLANVYNQAMEGFVDSNAIAALYEQFGDCSNFDSFIEAMQNIGDSAYDTEEAINSLANSYLDSKIPLDNLTEATKNQYIEELRRNGIVNAQEAIEERLAGVTSIRENALRELNSTSQYASLTAEELANTSIQELESMINSARASGVDCQALSQLYLIKLKAAGVHLDTTSDIEALINEAKAAGISTAAMSTYQYHKNAHGIPSSVLDELAQNAKNSILSAINTDLGFTPYKYTGKIGSNTPSTTAPSSSGQSTSAKEYNWMETAITRCTEALSRLKAIQENTFLSWSSRNQALNQEIAETGNQISILSQIYAGYMAQADASGLSEDYKAKVRNGSMQIESIADAGLQERIDQYQQWYKAAADIQSQIEELNRSLADLALKEFESIQSQFENRLSDFTNTASRIQDEMDLIEAKGHVVSQSMYRQLIANEKANRQELTSEREQLLRSLNAAIASGHLISGSEQWYEMQKKIQDVEAAIRKADQSLQDYNNSLRQLKWDAFDRMQEKLSGQIDESEYLRKLLEQEDTTDASGKHGLSKYGVAELDIRGANYQIYLEQIRKYKSEIASLDKQIAKDPGNQTLLERRQKLVEAQRESTLAAREEKQAMIELARKGYDAIIDSMEELISKKKEALKSEQDLYEYQKSIAEKTKNIATLEKQRAAYSNDTSEEGRKRLQEITVKLQEAQEDLKDTEYQKWISTQEDMMDQALSDYQTFVDEKFSDTDALIEELLTTTDENQSTTNRVLAELAKAAGYKLSEDLLKRIRAHNEIIYHVTPDLPLVYGNVTGAAAPVQSYSRKYELALQNLLQTTAHPSLPAQSVNSGDISIRIDQMNLPNVTRPEEFSRSLITALQNDSNVVKSIQAVSTDLIAGKSIHRVRRY